MNFEPKHLLECGLVAIASFISITPILLLNIKYAPKLGLIDWPKARGMTQEQVPIIGHSMLVLMIPTLFLINHFYGLSSWFVLTAILIAIMGHLDDRRPLPALDKLFFQVVCVAIVVSLDPQIQASIIQKYGVWGGFCAGFFILGLMNAVNFIDGIDGLASIVIAVGALGLVLLTLSLGGGLHYAFGSSVIVGMMVPFFYLNVRRRKGFLGNVGSYFLSYVLAVMHLSLAVDSPGPIARLCLTGLCFLIPIADACVVIFSRLFTLRSPFQADRGHLHHRLIQTSVPLRWILFNFALIEVCALCVAVLLTRHQIYVETNLPGYIGFGYLSIAAFLIILVEKASRRRIQSLFEALDSGEPVYFFKYQFTQKDGSSIALKTLRRLEARVSSEIRVTDLCFAQEPDTLFVTVRTAHEPVRGVAGRLDKIFQAEKVHSTVIVEKGEFTKVSHTRSDFAKKTA